MLVDLSPVPKRVSDVTQPSPELTGRPQRERPIFDQGEDQGAAPMSVGPRHGKLMPGAMGETQLEVHLLTGDTKCRRQVAQEVRR